MLYNLFKVKMIHSALDCTLKQYYKNARRNDDGEET